MLKCIKTKSVFTKIKLNNEWNINLLQNNPLSIYYTYSREFSIGCIKKTTYLVGLWRLLVLFGGMSDHNIACVFVQVLSDSQVEESLQSHH